MKRFYSLLAVLCLGVGFSAGAQLATYTFDDGFTPTTSNGLLEASLFRISSGNLLLSSVVAQGLNPPYAAGSIWDAESREDARYFYADLTAKEGFVIDIHRVTAVVFATASGPTVTAIRLNDTNFGEIALPSAQSVVLDTGNLDAFTGLTDIRIHFEAWLDGSRSSSGGGVFRIDDVVIEGVVRSVSDVPGLAIVDVPVVTDRGVSSARVSASLLFDGNQDVTSWGVLFGAVDDSMLNAGEPGVSFLPVTGSLTEVELTLDNLAEAERFAVRTVAVNGSGTVLSEVVRFATKRGFAEGEYVGSFADADVGFLAGAEWVFGDEQVVAEFGSGTTGGLRAGDGIVGYQLTAALNRFHAELTLVNTSGERLDEVIIGYHGWVERTGHTRSPAWEVSVNGVVYPELTYSTAEAVNKRGIQYLIDDLFWEPGDELVIRWSTGPAPGSGSYRQIGISDVVVAVPSTVQLSLEGDAGWRMFSMPFWYPSSQLINDISPVQGFVGQGFPPNVYAGYDGSNWLALSMDSSRITQPSLAPGSGYIVYVFDNNLGGSTPIGSGRNMQLTGIDLSSDVSIPVHADGDRWNLLGNPFPVAFDIRDLMFDSEGLPVVQIWKDAPGAGEPGGSANGSWVLSNSSMVNHILPAGQGFMWQNSETNPSSVLTFPHSGRLNTVGDRFKDKPPFPESRIEFMLTSATTSGGISTDRSMQLVFVPDFQNKEMFKVDKLGSLNLQPQVMFVDNTESASNRFLAQQALYFNFDGEIELPLLITQVDSTANHLTLSWPFLLDIPSYWALELIDKNTGQVVDMREVYELGIDIPNSSTTVESWVFRVRNMLINSSAISNELPQRTRLHTAYPNPFNPSATIRFELAAYNHVRLEVFDLLGRSVATLLNTEMAAGNHEIQFNAGHLHSGTYVLRMISGDFVSTQKLTLIK